MMARHQDQYGTDREDVFTWVSEFEAHHANGLLAKHGMRDIRRPKVDARNAINRLIRKRDT